MIRGSGSMCKLNCCSIMCNGANLMIAFQFKSQVPGEENEESVKRTGRIVNSNI